ncbi:MAG: iron-binding protein [Planctomyces sp.]|jgi:CDGSH-type Zn-finger protein|nr:iron-binding protein [Planctomyces sp.]
MAGSKIEVRENGPLRVYTPFEIVDKDGNAYTQPEGEFVTICRCGLSQNKPFCDTAHRAAEWKGEASA